MYFEQAYEGKNKWWMYLVTLIGVGLGYLVGNVPLMLQIQKAQQSSGLSEVEFQEQLLQQGMAILSLNENILFALFLFPFLPVLVVLYLFITKLHKKRFRAVLTTRQTFDWSRVILGFTIWFVLAVVLTFALLNREDYRYQLELNRFVPLLVVGILFVPVGAIVEEILFRSYLLKGIFLLAKSPIVSLLITSVLFGLLHGTNPEMQHGFFKFLSIYIFFGLVLGMIAILDEGLELAMGIHVSNNMFVALILSTHDGTFTTPSVFQTSVSALLEILPILLPVLSLLVFVVLFVKYKWSFSKLFASDDKPVDQIL